MPAGIRRPASAAIGVVVSVAALAVLAGTVDLSQTWATLRAADARPLALVPMVIAAQLVIRSWRWRLLLPPRPGDGSVSVRRLLPR